MIDLLNTDCMELMREYPDKHFDLAIVDVPYTDNYEAMQNLNQDMKGKVANVGQYHYNSLINAKPTAEYWAELKRVSKNQIVWGANHLIENLSSTPCVIVWDKDNSGNFADCEIAFGTFKSSARIFKWRWNGMLQQNMKQKEERIHPTQKPVALYDWILKNYAKQGDKILDTHGGSMSIAIAVHKANTIHNMNLSLVLSEIDTEYYNKGVERVNLFKSQTVLNFAD